MPLTRYCALGNSRSFTDPVSNVGNISILQDPGALRGLLRQSLPPFVVPTLLHEVTHSWCGLLPVGITLAIMNVKSREAIKTDSQDSFDLFMRYEIASSVLRPLAEGVALFAEFDATSHTRHQAQPLQIAEIFTTGSTIEELRNDHFEAILSKARIYPQFSAKKADLFATPFESSNGGYLPGYMLTRKLWSQIAEIDKGFLSSSTFFLHFVFHMYSDYRLISTIFDEDIALESLAEKICICLKQRIEEFTAGDVIDRRKKLEEHSDRVVGIERQMSECDTPNAYLLGLIASLEQAGKNDASAYLFNSHDIAEAGTKLFDEELIKVQEYANDFMNARRWVWLFSAEAEITLSDGMLIADFGNDASMEIHSKLLQREGMIDGWVSYLFSILDCSVVRVVGHDDEVVFYDNVGLISSPYADEVAKYAGSREKKIREEESMNKAMEEEFIKDERIVKRKKLISEAHDVVTQWMLSEVVKDIENVSKGVVDELRSNGLFSLFGDKKVVRALGIFSTCAAVKVPCRAVENMFSNAGINLDSFMNDVNNLPPELGIRCSFDENLDIPICTI